MPEPLIREVGASDPIVELAADVERGFAVPGARSLPPVWFYDREGSRLYQRITTLPEYYPTRTEAAILRAAAPALRDAVGPAPLVELGSGSSQKTRLLLDAWGARDRETSYVAIDVSGSALRAAAAALARDYPALRVLALAGRYRDALAALPDLPGKLVLFLGSSIGNFDPEQQERFAARLRAALRPGDHFLIGFDRRAHPGKPAERIRLAYDDAAGVTARFNLNLLARLRRDLGADFDLARWRHRAVYADPPGRIELYLDSLADQTVRVAALGRDYRFARGEGLLTEISCKYDPAEFRAWWEARGYARVALWEDPDALFGVLLLRFRGS